MVPRFASIAVFFAVAGVVGFAGCLSQPAECPECHCPPCPSPFEAAADIDSPVSVRTSDAVYYVYPTGCEKCNPAGVAEFGQELGVDIIPVSNDAIPASQLLVIADGRSSIAATRNVNNMLRALCAAGVSRACEVEEEELSLMQACLAENNISLNTTIFFYSDTCPHCEEMYPRVERVEGKGFPFLRVNAAAVKGEPAACLTAFLNLAGGTPQFICPADGTSSTGAMGYGSLLGFAEDCADTAALASPA